MAESAVPGANISEVARRNGVNRGLLTVWRREAGVIPDAALAETPLFIPVTVAEEPPPAPPEHRKRFERTLLPETVSVTEIAGGFTGDGGHDGRRRQASSQA